MATKQRPTRSAVSARKPAAKTASRSPKTNKSSAKKVAAKPATKLRGNGGPVRTQGSKGRSAPQPRATAKLPRPAPASAGQPRTALALSVPSGPSSHDLAVEAFERGFRALQVRNFADAAATLGSIIQGYPDEKELHERARVYIAICERQIAPGRDSVPRTIEERINAATVAINRGNYSDALRFLDAAKVEDADNDAVHYMLAVAHAGLGNADSAIPHLHEAIELNPDNRFLAAQDSDLDPIRAHEAFVALLDSPPPPRRRPATRGRSTR